MEKDKSEYVRENIKQAVQTLRTGLGATLLSAKQSMADFENVRQVSNKFKGLDKVFDMSTLMAMEKNKESIDGLLEVWRDYVHSINSLAAKFLTTQEQEELYIDFNKEFDRIMQPV